MANHGVAAAAAKARKLIGVKAAEAAAGWRISCWQLS